MVTPVVLITGTDSAAMAAVTVSLQWELSNSVVVRHEVDVERGTVTRTISDASGIIELAEVAGEHWCVSCPATGDLLQTIERCAATGRWHTVIAHLPRGAEATDLCERIDTDPALMERLRVTSVITALRGDVASGGLAWDLLGDALLEDRGLHSCAHARRGEGDLLCSMIEYADVVVVADECGSPARSLVRALAAPGTLLPWGAEHLTAAALLQSRHLLARSRDWTRGPRPRSRAQSEDVWQIVLESERPFHPVRFREGIDRLAAGPYRSRGHFWLPTRSYDALSWAGAGGEVTVGAVGTWGSQAPSTRIVFTGIGQAPSHLQELFDAMLLREDEPNPYRNTWLLEEDGLEPWLGDISRQLA